MGQSVTGRIATSLTQKVQKKIAVQGDRQDIESGKKNNSMSEEVSEKKCLFAAAAALVNVIMVPCYTIICMFQEKEQLGHGNNLCRGLSSNFH